MKITTKTLKLSFTAAVSSLLLSVSSAYAGAVNVSEDVTLTTKAAAVWALVGDFNGLYRWHPAVSKSDRNNNVRILSLANGATITETLLSESENAYTYRIDNSPLPVANYEATIKVSAGEAGKTMVTWSASFDAKDVSDEEAANIMRGVYRAGLDNLAELYN